MEKGSRAVLAGQVGGLWECDDEGKEREGGGGGGRVGVGVGEEAGGNGFIAR